MGEQLSEKELKLEQELAEAQQKLEKVRAVFQKAEQVHDNLRRRQPTAQLLDRVRNQLAELSQLPPLENQSPFTDTEFTKTSQVNQYYAGLIERIKSQVGRFRENFTKSEERLENAKKALGELRRHVDKLSAELEDARPAMRARTVIQIGEDGVEREFTVMYRREPLMPWSESRQDALRFKKIWARTMVAAILLTIILQFFPVPEIERAQIVEIPDRIAQLAQTPKPPPPPPPPPKLEKEKVAKDPLKKKKLQPRKRAAQPKTEVARAAREKAARTGLFAASGGGDFSDLLDNPATSKLGKQGRVTSGGVKARQTTRNLITAAAGQGSGGLSSYSLSRDVAGSGLSGRGTSRVTGAIGGSFGDAQRPLADSVRGSRTDEEIQLVFDRNKSALYSIYQRALRKDPTLQGKIVLKITIDPAGRVTAASVSSSDLGDKALELKIALRVKQFNFGAKDVDTITIRYPIDFLPA